MSSTADNPPPADEEELSDERLPLTELESVSARPPSWRKRGAQLALLALALCVGLVATWSAIIPKRQPAQPKLTSMPAELVSNLTNATITLNGKKLVGHPPMVISAYLETDAITIAAPGFRSHTCHFTGLTTTGDPTHCMWIVNNGFNQISSPFIIGVYLTPDDLLPGQKDQLVTPLIQQLAAREQTTTQPGDLIATAFAAFDNTITSQQTTVPLQASAALGQDGTPPSISSVFYPFSPACNQLFCPLGFGPSGNLPAPAPTADQSWGLLLNVALRWRFTSETGTPVADVTYPLDAIIRNSFPPLLQVQYVYDATGWHLSTTDLNTALPNFLCTQGMSILVHRVPSGSNSFGIGPDTNNGVEGCLISLQVNDSKGLFLWRFGVLLAADAGAHTILPDLPIASPAAIAAVSG